MRRRWSASRKADRNPDPIPFIRFPIVKHFKQALSLMALGVMQASGVLAAAPATGNEVEARVSSILDNMNQAEKINFTRVDDGHMIPSLPKWGIKGTLAYDSSMGVHVNNATFGAQYPSQSALAAT